jgi:predicted DNA-binding transcriptional regulator YafY
MPEKKDSYSSYGQKLISLFAKMLFTQQKHSLIGLSKMLNCSKQTVQRLVDDIRRSYGVEVEDFLEDRRKYYRIKRLNGNIPVLDVTESELNALYMCKTFTEHLMGKKLFEEASHALEKNHAALPPDKAPSPQHFASFRSGSIDYTPASRAKTFHIKPLKIFSHKDSVYVHACLARAPGKPYKEPEFNPLLAIHRIKKIEITDRLFEFPKNYDFDKAFKQNFGVIKEDAFEVEVEFTDWAAKYVSERIWSPDQKIHKKNGTTKLTFSASSEPELISWVLSFGHQARLKKPDSLATKVKKASEDIKKIYV